MHTNIRQPGRRRGDLLCRVRGGVVNVAAAAGVVLPLAGAVPAHAETRRVYAAPGTTTFTVPTRVSRIRVVLTGAGGGGSMGTRNDAYLPSGSGGGGGATSFCTLAVHPGDTMTITVGAGGAAPNGDGLSGTASSVAYPNAGGASADAGGGGHTGPGGHGNAGGAGGMKATWCVGDDAGHNFGQDGTAGVKDTGGPGGAPGAGVSNACPAGTGRGGNGADSAPAPFRRGFPGANGCVVLTY
ncbi:glycine-rich domain-containing protein [Actinoallomurus rhizosphaericola]|uniref:glycine-rich domain-containing protein n=1 Tax=Actinoallomurus rhizosphaericola TaxID=2952536 RepID=UPI0020920B7B|nr:hypothetical protein [Actinoallomurus rhizosphaericola]MCO5999373.1 hypothetical protein [Actinoallomurus rhizosphaericola]